MDYKKTTEYFMDKNSEIYEKSYIWDTAIGLQKVDALENSDYLYDIAKRHIEGEISFTDAKDFIHSYYESKPNASDKTEEADKVAVRIAEILSEKTFSFSSVEYISIHYRLFEGIYEFAGKIRNYNISKKEWVLDGQSVIYGDAYNLRETLEYDLQQEKEFSYRGLSTNQIIHHIAKFITNLWQNHIFGEGNTRTTAVFLIKYLHTLGYTITNNMFLEHAWYFRNALVRANYTNVQKGIFSTTYYLELFLRNLLLNESNELSNKKIHIHYHHNLKATESYKIEDMVIEILRENPNITLLEVADKLNKSLRTVKTTIKKLIDTDKVMREGSKKTGKWIVKSSID